jgi:hypothetical protein
MLSTVLGHGTDSYGGLSESQISATAVERLWGAEGHTERLVKRFPETTGLSGSGRQLLMDMVQMG